MRERNQLLRADLADCHGVAGEPEEGARIAVEALDLADGALVKPILLRVSAFRSGVGRWSDTRAVAELDARLRVIAPAVRA